MGAGEWGICHVNELKEITARVLLLGDGGGGENGKGVWVGGYVLGIRAWLQ